MRFVFGLFPISSLVLTPLLQLNVTLSLRRGTLNGLRSFLQDCDLLCDDCLMFDTRTIIFQSEDLTSQHAHFNVSSGEQKNMGPKISLSIQRQSSTFAVSSGLLTIFLSISSSLFKDNCYFLNIKWTFEVTPRRLGNICTLGSSMTFPLNKKPPFNR